MEMEWEWRDAMKEDKLFPACLIITPDGDVHRFLGMPICDVVDIIEVKTERTGKRGCNRFFCQSPAGTSLYIWHSAAYDNFWPQDSWEAAIATIQKISHKTKPSEIEKVIRRFWPMNAHRFDRKKTIV
ncbi:hypothetical protein ACFL2B_03150 [Patescibacteria group bacterium]